MSFNKKTISILLILILSISVLAGCAGQKPVPTATVAPATEEPTVIPEEPTTEVPAAEPTAETVEQPAEEAEVPAEEPAAETAEQPAEEAEAPAEEPAAETAEQPAEEAEAPAEEPAAETAEQPAEETEAPAVEPAAETAEKPAEEAEAPAEEPAAETAEQPAEEAKAPAEEPMAEAVSDSGQQFAATVDGEGISLDSFIQAATFNRYQYLNMYGQYAQMYRAYGLPLDSLNEQMIGILGKEGKERLGAEVIDQLTYDKVLELEAKEAGLDLTEPEIYTQLKSMFGYEDPAPEAEGLADLESFNVTLEATASEDDKNEAFRSFAQSVLDQSYNGAVSFDYLKNYAKNVLTDNKLFAKELEDRVFEAEMVSARHILVEDEETAEEILAKLEAGEEWAALASEYSLDTSNKDNSGDLGWFGRGEMVAEFEDAAFALEPGMISDPVKSNFGYHIIASDGKEVRPLSGSALQNAQNAAYDEWALALRAKHDIQSNSEIWMDAVPMEPAFVAPESASAADIAEIADEETAEAEVSVEDIAEATEVLDEEETEAVEETVIETAENEVPAEEAEVTEETPAESAEPETPAEEQAEATEVPAEETEVTEETPAETAEAQVPAVEQAEVTEVPVEETEVTEEMPAETAEAEVPAAEQAEATEVPAEETEMTEETPAETEEAEVPAAEQAEETGVTDEVSAEETAVSEETALAAASVPAISEAAAESSSEEISADAVAIVDGKTVITSDEFSTMAVYSRYQVLSTYSQYAQYYAMFGMPLDDVNTYYEQLLGESGKEEFGRSVIDQLAYYKMLEEEADSKGIHFTDKEVTSQLKQAFGYENAADEAETSLGLDSFNLEADEGFDEDTDDEFKSEMEMNLDLSFNGNISYDFFEEVFRYNLLEEAVLNKVLEDRVFESEMVNARHILVEDEETAQEILMKLEEGEDWDALAAEYSLDTGNKDYGGALGWFGHDVMVDEFEEAAFALEPGEISEPVKTSFGWHIIASDGKEIRPLEDEALQSAQNEVFQEWYEDLLAKHQVVDFPEVWLPLVPTEPAFEPIVIDTESSDIPTFHILPEGEETGESEEEQLTINNTEQEEALTISSTEQEESAFMVTNGAEEARTVGQTESEGEVQTSGDDTVSGEFKLSNDSENK